MQDKDTDYSNSLLSYDNVWSIDLQIQVEYVEIA